VNRTPRYWLPLLMTLLVIVLDRATKQFVSATMDLGQSIPFISDTIQWTLVYNYGMAFGMKFTGGAVLGYISVIAVVVIMFVLLRTPPKSIGTRWVLAMILGGAIGNTYDRIVHGYVIDFIDVDLPNFLMERWPVFNIADSAVSVGVVLLVLMMIFIKEVGEETEDLSVDEENIRLNSDGHTAESFMSSTSIGDEKVSEDEGIVANSEDDDLREEQA
jgi:signal peptidase II